MSKESIVNAKMNFSHQLLKVIRSHCVAVRSRTWRHNWCVSELLVREALSKTNWCVNAKEWSQSCRHAPCLKTHFNVMQLDQSRRRSGSPAICLTLSPVSELLWFFRREQNVSEFCLNELPHVLCNMLPQQLRSLVYCTSADVSGRRHRQTI